MHHPAPPDAISLRNVTLRFVVRPRLPRGFARLAQAGGAQAVGGSLAAGRRRRLEVTALDGVNVTIRAGQRVGVIGHNGAGKSVLLKVMAGIFHPTIGTCETRGRVSTLFTTMLDSHRDATGLENIHRCGYAMGLDGEEIDARIPDIVEWSGLGDYIYLPMQTYSPGMRARLAASLATHVDADVLLIDEVVGAADSSCRKRLSHAVHASDKTLVLASHSAATIREFCDTAIWMDGGRVRGGGDARELLDEFKSQAGRSRPRAVPAEHPDNPLARARR